MQVKKNLTHNPLSCAVRWKRTPWRGCNWCQSILCKWELYPHQRCRWTPCYSGHGQFLTAKTDTNDKISKTQNSRDANSDQPLGLFALTVLLTISSSWRQIESSSLPNRKTKTFSATPLITSSMSFLHVNLGKNKLIFEDNKLASLVQLAGGSYVIINVRRCGGKNPSGNDMKWTIV